MYNYDMASRDRTTDYLTEKFLIHGNSIKSSAFLLIKFNYLLRIIQICKNHKPSTSSRKCRRKKFSKSMRKFIVNYTFTKG
jgi:hypothetical protein